MDALHLQLDRTSSTPLGEQVCEQVRALIAGGTLPSGSRLPSSRLLADQLGVSRNTVVGAYERLLADGWVASGVGRGTFVAEKPPMPEAETRGATTASPSATSEAFPWLGAVVRDAPPPVQMPGVNASAEGDGAVVPIDLAGAVPSPASYPLRALRRALDHTLAHHGAAALGYGPPAGYRPLRAFIAERATRRGVPTRPRDVLIVGGSQQGLDLVARLLIRPGDGVAVESPTYANASQLWRLHGARLWGVPMDDSGVRPDALETLLRRERPKLVYLMPTFQNPTGLTMDATRREAVMQVVREAQVPVIEDQFDAELRFEGQPEAPLKALDVDGQVILLGTFSKILCPGLRLGWIIAPSSIRRRLLDVKQIADLTTSLPLQMAVATLAERGDFDRHLAEVRVAHAHRLRVLLDALAVHLPSSEATRPAGGMTLWLTLPPGISAMEVHRRALAHGVAVAPGPWFEPDGAPATDTEHLRLSFVCAEAPDIEEGIRRLARAIDDAVTARADRGIAEEATLFV